MSKLLTFIVPSYNMEKFLPRCLDSLGLVDLALTILPNGESLASKLEVLVVNDGSTDNTSEIAHQYERRFPDVIRVLDKENGNYGSCVNVSLRKAVGQYVKMLDADDFVESKGLLSYLYFLLSLKTSVDLIINDYDEVDFMGQANRHIRYSLPSDRVFSMDVILESNVFIPNYSIAYRREVLITTGYRQTENILYTDTEWHSLPMAHVQYAVYSPGPLMHYYVGRNGQSVSPDSFVRNIAMLEIIAKRMIYELRELGDGNSPGRQYMRRRIVDLLRLMYSMVLIGYKGRKAEFDLLGFDAWLNHADHSLYEDLDGFTWFSRWPFRFIAEWRRTGTNKTWRYRLFQLVLRVASICGKR